MAPGQQPQLQIALPCHGRDGHHQAFTQVGLGAAIALEHVTVNYFERPVILLSMVSSIPLPSSSTPGYGEAQDPFHLRPLLTLTALHLWRPIASSMEVWGGPPLSAPPGAPGRALQTASSAEEVAWDLHLQQDTCLTLCPGTTTQPGLRSLGLAPRAI